MQFNSRVWENILSSLSSWLGELTSNTSIMLYILLVFAIGIVAHDLWSDKNTEPETLDFSDVLEEDTLEEGAAEGQILDKISETHKAAVAPEAIEWTTRSARVGDQWTSTLYIANYPDYPSDGYLSELYNRTDVAFDLTARFSPKNQDQARAELKDISDDLQVDAELEQSVRSTYLQERANEAAATYTAVENGSRVFDQSLFITVRADSKDALEKDIQKVKSALRDEPANLTPKTAICRQDSALQSCAPIGDNVFGRESIVLGGAVGAFLASPHNATILEEGGVEFGLHKDNQSPVVIDPFSRDNGYAMFTVGDTGSGKSFGSKQNFIRSIEQRDRVGIILEPLTNWAGISEALDAKRITVGGTLGLNPLELRQTPDHVQQAMGEDSSPFNEKLDDAMSFLTNFFALRGIPLDDRRTTLELGLREAYKRNGITEDISTHSNPSPTIRDIMDVFEELVDAPEKHIVRTDEESAKLQSDATWLLDQLRPFDEGGRFSNLGKTSEFSIRDEDVIYLDLAQQEGSVDSSTSLTMQLLISLVYERAKETDKEVVFVIDEARYIMQDATNLSFLETAFRHHRHHDLSIRLVTQTIDEFFEHPESEAILDQCSVKQFHRTDGMDEQWADEFGLNHAQMRYVQDAVPGNEETGFSEALVGVDGQWRGIRVEAMPAEKQVIDFDPSQHTRASLPTTADRSSDSHSGVEASNRASMPPSGGDE